jgi:hypothetical protein
VAELVERVERQFCDASATFAHRLRPALSPPGR